MATLTTHGSMATVLKALGDMHKAFGVVLG
jgi:hypothetical protein